MWFNRLSLLLYKYSEASSEVRQTSFEIELRVCTARYKMLVTQSRNNIESPFLLGQALTCWSAAKLHLLKITFCKWSEFGYLTAALKSKIEQSSCEMEFGVCTAWYSDTGCLWRKAEIISNHPSCWGKPWLAGMQPKHIFQNWPSPRDLDLVT